MSMTPPTTGHMRFKLRFERQVSSANIGGVIETGWATITGAESISAAVDPTRGGEEIIAGRMAGKASYDIWVRSSILLRGLTNKDRAVNTRTGEIYNIGQPIDPMSSRQWLFLQAVSGGNAQGQG